jgi:hypothetical protein
MRCVVDRNVVMRHISVMVSSKFWEKVRQDIFADLLNTSFIPNRRQKVLSRYNLSQRSLPPSARGKIYSPIFSTPVLSRTDGKRSYQGIIWAREVCRQVRDRWLKWKAGKKVVKEATIDRKKATKIFTCAKVIYNLGHNGSCKCLHTAKNSAVCRRRG